jgi:hypothetical protein
MRSPLTKGLKLMEMHKGDKVRLQLFMDGLTSMGLKLEAISDSSWYLTSLEGIKIALINYDSNKPFSERFEIEAIRDRPFQSGLECH